jgi:hypothetical protein
MQKILKYPNWFAGAASRNFERFLLPLAGRADYRCLQLGVFTGDASLWLLKNILTEDSSYLTDVDTWRGSQIAVYDKINIEDLYTEYCKKVSEFTERIEIYRSNTLDFLCARYSSEANYSHYDFIYIDADHTAIGVLTDAVLSWPLLKRGGILAFDDYAWHHETLNPMLEPKRGVDMFLEHYRAEYELLVTNWQVWIMKK